MKTKSNKTEVLKAPVALSYAGYTAAWGKCRQLGKQLSVALAQTGDHVFAYIQPVGHGHACTMAFGPVDSQGISPSELAVQTVDKLAARLAFALDDWGDDTGWHSAAHVYPASTTRGVWYENINHEVAAKRPNEQRRHLDMLLDQAATILASNPGLGIHSISIDRHGVSTLQDIPGVSV